MWRELSIYATIEKVIINTCGNWKSNYHHVCPVTYKSIKPSPKKKKKLGIVKFPNFKK